VVLLELDLILNFQILLSENQTSIEMKLSESQLLIEEVNVFVHHLKKYCVAECALEETAILYCLISNY